MNSDPFKVHLVNEVEEIVSLSKIYSKWLDRYEDVIANEIQHSDDAVDKFNEIFNPYANVEWRK